MTVAEFLNRISQYLLGPFASATTLLRAVSGLPRTVTELGSQSAWPYLVSSLFIAAAIWWVGRRRGLIDGSASLRAFLFPPSVYRHPSAIVDYRYLAIDLSIRGVVYMPLVAGVSYLLYKVLQPFVGTIVGSVGGGLPSISPLGRGIAITLLSVLVYDFLQFVGHFLAHNVPLLWYFHQVHHSAQVLTPATVYRSHPVDALLGGLLGAVAAAVYSSASGQELRPITLFGVNVVTGAFYLTAFQLRHSHVWLSYGPIVSRIFISPAQHQIHHSADPKHWNKNYGFMFSIWDTLFRSLYVPRSRERLRFGLSDSDATDFATVRALYFLPFVKAARHCLNWAVQARDRERQSPSGSIATGGGQGRRA
jgi:sterol desaturase/sphingolipid hydroxylase (fatty acid hydroxylase superfamily)